MFLVFHGTVVNANGIGQYDRKVEVNYTFDGKTYHFIGESRLNGFIFNQNGNQTVTIATLDWPPYVGRELCNLGWSLQLAVAILTAKDYRVEVYFYPWVRAVKLVETGKIDILFPEYFIEDHAPSDIFLDKKRRELLVQSNQFIGGNISLFKRKSDPFTLDNGLESLTGKVIGVVRGYQNTPEFDAMMDQGLISTVEAIDDAQLLRLLLAGRVDLIIGDGKVFNYVIDHSGFDEKTKQAINQTLMPLKPVLKYNALYFAISLNYQGWKPLLTDINLALIAFDLSGEMTRIYEQGSQCAGSNNSH